MDGHVSKSKWISSIKKIHRLQCKRGLYCWTRLQSLSVILFLSADIDLIFFACKISTSPGDKSYTSRMNGRFVVALEIEHHILRMDKTSNHHTNLIINNLCSEIDFNCVMFYCELAQLRTHTYNEFTLKSFHDSYVCME